VAKGDLLLTDGGRYLWGNIWYYKNQWLDSGFAVVGPKFDRAKERSLVSCLPSAKSPTPLWADLKD
jgi:hypothetical protein